jgi:hypothetical protein
MPTKEKLLRDNWCSEIPKVLKNSANTKPATLPVNKEGAKTPPTPPAPNVIAVATTLKATNPIKKRMMTHWFSGDHLKNILVEYTVHISVQQFVDGLKAFSVERWNKIEEHS